MPLPLLCIRFALLYAVIAMALGLHMAMTQDASMSVAHAHLAIIGWFGLLSTGVLMRTFPELGERGGKLIVWGLIIGVPVLSAGFMFASRGAALGTMLMAIGGLVLFLSVTWLATKVWMLKP